MATVINSIQFKRGTKANLEAKLVDDKKPLKGEPIWETDTNKIKVGDGVNDYADLPYLGAAEENIVIEGYYVQEYDTFFKESAHINPIIKKISKLYKDIPTGLFYYLSNNVYTGVYQIADETHYGVSKLYKSSGQNEDGSISQKIVTNSISSIEFKITEDGAENCLDLQKPW